MSQEVISCIPPTLEGWVYIKPIHGPLDGPLYTPTNFTVSTYFYYILNAVGNPSLVVLAPGSKYVIFLLPSLHLPLSDMIFMFFFVSA